MPMNSLIILNPLEEEYLVRASEAAIDVRQLRQLFLWTQGQFQGLMPHQIMVCIQFSEHDDVLGLEYFDSVVRDPAFARQLCQREEGLALRLARHCRTRHGLPCSIEQGASEPALAGFHSEMTGLGLHNALLHGTETLRGGSTFFALFSIADQVTPRHIFFIELLLPHLHLAFQRVMAGLDKSGVPDDAMRPLTARELEILTWVMKGKSNFEIGAIVHLSPLTVKNHLQNIYKKLNVHNRVQAIARCYALQLFNTKKS